MKEATPRHLRAAFVARIADAYFDNLQEALDAASDEPVVLLRNTMLRHDLHITNRKTTIDLAGYSLMASALPTFSHNETMEKQSGDLNMQEEKRIVALETDRLPTIVITAPKARIRNGSLILGLQVLTLDGAPPSSLELNGVRMTFEQGQRALLARSSSVVIHSSQLSSAAQGIVATGEKSFLSITSSRINARDHAVIVQGGACHIKESTTHSTRACGLLLKGGYTLVSASDVSSQHSYGLATRATDSRALPRVVIKSMSDISSAGSVALGMPCGEVLVEHSRIRSTAATGIRVGTTSGNGHASLTLSNDSEVISWGGRGVHVLSGDFFHNGAQIHALRGQQVEWNDSSFNAETTEHVTHTTHALPKATPPKHLESSEEDFETKTQVAQEAEAAPKEASTEETAAERDASEPKQKRESVGEAESMHEPSAEPTDAHEQESASHHEQSTQHEQSKSQNQIIDHICLQGVTANLSYRRPAEFTAELDADDVFSIHMEIMMEQWTNGSDIISSLSPGTPAKGDVYRYIVTIRARKGYEFAPHPEFYFEGHRLPYKALMSRDYRLLIIHWGLETMPNSIPLPRPMRQLFA